MENINLREQLALYQEIAEKKLKCVIDKYVKSEFELYDIFDKETGSIYLTDKDSVLLNSKHKEHPIFEIFDIDCIENCRKYTCNMNDRILLRGAQYYYFGFCYLDDLDVKNGTQALVTYAMFDRMTKDELDFKYNSLLEYCKQDTWAMVVILDKIREIVKD